MTECKAGVSTVMRLTESNVSVAENAIILNQIYNPHLYPYGDCKILEDRPPFMIYVQ